MLVTLHRNAPTHLNVEKVEVRAGSVVVVEYAGGRPKSHTERNYRVGDSVHLHGLDCKVNRKHAGVALLVEQLICNPAESQSSQFLGGVMYRVKAYFKDSVVARKFYDLYDAIEWKDSADAHQPRKNNFRERYIFHEGMGL